MKRMILMENNNGIIYRYSKVPNNMFNFYIWQRRKYKNGKSLWNICVEIAVPPAGKNAPDCIYSPSNYIKLQSIRCTKIEAKKQLDKIIKEYMS